MGVVRRLAAGRRSLLPVLLLPGHKPAVTLSWVACSVHTKCMQPRTLQVRPSKSVIQTGFTQTSRFAVGRRAGTPNPKIKPLIEESRKLAKVPPADQLGFSPKV